MTRAEHRLSMFCTCPEAKEAKRATTIPSLEYREAKPDRYQIVQLDCGGVHTVALTDDGKVVIWGCNNKSTLSRPSAWEADLRDVDDVKDDGPDSEDSDEQTVCEPSQIDPYSCPRSIIPFWDKIGLSLSNDQIGDPKLGRNEYAQLWIFLKPLAVSDVGNATYAACFTCHMVLVNSEGQAFAAGFGFQYQLGDGTTDNFQVAREVKLKALKNVELT